MEHSVQVDWMKHLTVLEYVLECVQMMEGQLAEVEE